MCLFDNKLVCFDLWRTKKKEIKRVFVCTLLLLLFSGKIIPDQNFFNTCSMGKSCRYNLSLFLSDLWWCFAGGFQTKNGARLFGLKRVCRGTFLTSAGSF
jgi:hypothetical protein